MFSAYTLVPSGNVTCVPGLRVDVLVLLINPTIAHRISRAGWSSKATPWSLAESGHGRPGDHEHRRSRLARHALAILPRSDGGQAAGSGRDRRASGCCRPD